MRLVPNVQTFLFIDHLARFSLISWEKALNTKVQLPFRVFFAADSHTGVHAGPTAIGDVQRYSNLCETRISCGNRAPTRSHGTPCTNDMHERLPRMATGPAAGGQISDELLDKLGSLSTQALIDGLWVMGWPTSHTSWVLDR